MHMWMSLFHANKKKLIDLNTKILCLHKILRQNNQNLSKDHK